MDATLAMDATAPALSQKISILPKSLGGRDVQSLEKVGGKFDSTGAWYHGIHLLYVPHGCKSTFQIGETAKRLVEAQPNPLCLPGSG